MLMDACGIIKRGITPKYAEKGILVLNQRCIRDQRVSTEVARRHDCDARKVPVDRVVQEGDVLINSTGVGTLGRVAQVKDINENTTVDSHVTLVRLADRENIHIDFFGWAMKYKQPIFEAMGEGSTGQTELSRHRVGEVIINYPPLPEQKAIAYILGKLDDKIELNRQMNETLEAMAQALFKSWFVDFDPVIDNALLAGKAIPEPLKERAEMRQAQLDSGKAKTNSEINDLFPSEFEFTEELGWIPKGWSDGNLSDFSFVKGGYAFKSKDFTNEGLPVIKIKNINDDRTVNVYDVQYIPEGIAKNSKEFFLETGDLIMAMTGATVGKFGLLVAENAQSYLLNQRVAKFTSSIDQVSKVWFIYCFLNQKSTINHIVNIAEGSAQPNISATSIMATPSIVPTIEIINGFGNLVDGYFSKMIVNRQEIYTLAKLRDTLLPKLMSGELRIADAEKLAENI